jgi:hypothetical protein
MNIKVIQLLCFVGISILGYSQNTIRLDQINLSNATSRWGTSHINQSVNGDP